MTEHLIVLIYNVMLFYGNFISVAIIHWRSRLQHFCFHLFNPTYLFITSQFNKTQDLDRIVLDDIMENEINNKRQNEYATSPTLNFSPMNFPDESDLK